MTHNQWGERIISVRNPALLPLQELSRVAAAAGLPGADSWVQPNSSTWPAVWAAITKVCHTAHWSMCIGAFMCLPG